jgi:hypothetical protein
MFGIAFVSIETQNMKKRFRERSKCEATASFCRIDMRRVCRFEVVINIRKIRESWRPHCIIGERPIIKPIRRYWRRVARCGGTVGLSLMSERHRSRFRGDIGRTMPTTFPILPRPSSNKIRYTTRMTAKLSRRSSTPRYSAVQCTVRRRILFAAYISHAGGPQS